MNENINIAEFEDKKHERHILFKIYKKMENNPKQVVPKPT